MITAAMSSPIFSDAVQNSVFQVLSEGSLKTVARPLFTLVDKNGTPESRKYSAVKEFVFQTLSLLFYFVLVRSLVEQKGYKLIKKVLENKPDFKILKNHATRDSFMEARSLALKSGIESEEAKFIHPKGAIEALNILGSGIILTILAPKVVMQMVHPTMKQVDKLFNKEKAAKEQKNGDVFQKSETKS
ncbi:MAG TPA: hypothetical protein PKI94_07065 [Candidatus Gastranaerophilaceae bacterium]|nr:hypothetical protein [Candidatus Gastranaerophilaceae bacterium]